MKKIFYIITIVLSFTFSLEISSKEEMKTITLGVTAPVLKSSQGQFSEKLIRNILKRLNFKLIVKTFPPIRLAERTKSGAIDGELIRMSKYGEGRPHLTKVEESNFDFNLSAYSNKNNLKIKDWDSFSGLHIAYRRGMKVIEKELVKRYQLDHLHSFPDPSASIKLVTEKRVDVLIGVEYFMEELLSKTSHLHNGKIKKLLRLKSDSAHVFLSKKYSYLAPIYSSEMKKMKKMKSKIKID